MFLNPPRENFMVNLDELEPNFSPTVTPGGDCDLGRKAGKYHFSCTLKKIIHEY